VVLNENGELVGASLTDLLLEAIRDAQKDEGKLRRREEGGGRREGGRREEGGGRREHGGKGRTMLLRGPQRKRELIGGSLTDLLLEAIRDAQKDEGRVSKGGGGRREREEG
jgi:hypothetical protein